MFYHVLFMVKMRMIWGLCGLPVENNDKLHGREHFFGKETFRLAGILKSSSGITNELRDWMV